MNYFYYMTSNFRTYSLQDDSILTAFQFFHEKDCTMTPSKIPYDKNYVSDGDITDIQIKIAEDWSEVYDMDKNCVIKTPILAKLHKELIEPILYRTSYKQTMTWRTKHYAFIISRTGCLSTTTYKKVKCSSCPEDELS